MRYGTAARSPPSVAATARRAAAGRDGQHARTARAGASVSGMDFDAVDRAILEILRTDGRATHAQIAKEVGLSAPAVGERIRKLEHAGVIVGYRAVIDPGKVGLGISAFVAISPQPRKPAALLVERLLAMPEIEELHAVAGTYAYVAKVRVTDTPALDAFLDRLFMLDGVERTETTMVLRTNAERPLHLPFEGAS
jgi:Lrp/AsnC family transcriptional regulator, leucine-responsive regulatory protein